MVTPMDTLMFPLGHVVGLPVEEMVPAILAGASLAVSVLYRAASARLGRTSSLRRRLRPGFRRRRTSR